LLPGPRNPLLSLVPGAVGVAALVFFLLLPRYAGRLSESRLPAGVRTLLAGTAQAIRDTRQYLFKPDWRILGAILFLWADIGVLVACFAAAGDAPPLAPIVLAYQIAYLSNLVPIPGGIGVLDGSFVGMLVLYGVNATTATAVTLVYHAISLCIPAAWGALAFLMLRLTRNKPLELRPTRAERHEARSRD
jgi:uncharacterized protein (TIRG00374 family)